MFDVKKILATVIAILNVVATKTTSTIDDQILSLCRALEASPFLLDWIQGRLASTPEGALASIDPEDPQLIAAIEASPEMLRWGRRGLPRDTVPAGAPDDAKGIGIGSALAIAKLLIQYWPIIAELIKAWKGAQTPAPTE